MEDVTMMLSPLPRSFKIRPETLSPKNYDVSANGQERWRKQTHRSTAECKDKNMNMVAYRI